MVELQQASAGSGKTYTLAKKYIWYFITIATDEGRRLRTPAELSDSAEHILAVTFTNKATNEMQQRIVEKLYHLGYGTPTGNRPDYLDDYIKELNKSSNKGVRAEDVAEVCRKGVEILLTNYSDFHVSTIDSFFQQVLRTFAYESNLNDSYRIEIDSETLSAVSIDSLLESINSGTDTTGASYWISELIDRARQGGKKWNIFSSTGSPDGAYQNLAASVRRLENEEFKEIRHKLEEYFEKEKDLEGIYKSLKKRLEEPVRALYKNFIWAAEDMKRLLRKISGKVDDKDIKPRLSRLKKILDTSPFSLPAKGFNEVKETDIYLKRRAKGSTELYEEMERADKRLQECYEKWRDALSTEEFKHWTVYRENMPFLGLLQVIRDKRTAYLRETNAVELGETNVLLSDIIGESDTPFIYERLGTRLNHYLIDEFQDTSKMQWKIMSPLLHESISKGNENLIIGDAKQSIYRFRNADSSLISQRIPDEFGIGTDSFNESQNTNWRSRLHIVEFNNTLFHWLPRELNRETGVDKNPHRRDYASDYRNVVQRPSHTEEEGYVEVHLTTSVNKVLVELPDLLEDILSRGYRMRDIAILVDTTLHGENIIDTLTSYNAESGENGRKFEFVSEQSLKLKSSAAVNIIISVLETISRGANPEIRKGNDRNRRGVADWHSMDSNYKFYILRHPELTSAEALEKFFNEGSDNDAIADMLDRMQAVSLPALIEAITAEFVSEDMRSTDAVFLAAFQDIVLEYCENRPSDIAAFLEWWNVNGEKASIASPEGMDAIQIMTVHKSKGLEFPVVIVPFANESLRDSDTSKYKTEWRWVEPLIKTESGKKLPDYIPIAVNSSLEGTVHERLLHEYYDLKKMDYLNSLYVAFTRAEFELYVFSTVKKENTENSDRCNFGNMLRRFFEMEMSRNAREDYHIKGELCHTVDDEIYTYGDKAANYKSKESGGNGEVVMNDYITRPTPDFLAYRREDVPGHVEVENMTIDEKEDPRSEGSLIHSVMENVGLMEDIPRAVRRLVIKGRIGRRQGEELGKRLEEMIKTSGVEEWFAGNYRVIPERPLLHSGRGMRRPDRVMVTSDGDAIVVDYKFGESESSTGTYKRQIAGYMRALRETGKFKNITGYLWYARLGKVIEIID